jgi:hypothetical protein
MVELETAGGHAGVVSGQQLGTFDSHLNVIVAVDMWMSLPACAGSFNQAWPH